MEMSSPNSLTFCRNFTLSQICDQVPLLCLRPLSTPCLPCPCARYPSIRWHLPPDFYFKWDGVSKAHTSDIPVAWTCVLTLWERVLLSSGQVPACPRKHLCNWAVAEVQRLWQIITHSWCQVSPLGIFVPIPSNVAALWGLLGSLLVGKPYDLYQILSNQGNC